MKRAALICFTKNGLATALRCGQMLTEEGFQTDIWIKKKDVQKLPTGVTVLEMPLREWSGLRFADSELICFIGATGIAVRAVGPYAADKTKDPAVLCIDERGTFVIPLLSGHIGGANARARALAAALGATPVITTATDLNNRFAVDVFAKRNDLRIGDMKLAKEISAALLDGLPVGFVSIWPASGDLPEGLTEPKDASSGLCICITDGSDGCAEALLKQKTERPLRVLELAAPSVTLGAGCRKGKDPDRLEAFLLRTLAQHRLSVGQIRRICSIDLKEEEEAICRFADRYALPYITYTSEELKQCPGQFAPSAFVAQTTGVDNVCERSAVLGSGGKLIIEKTAQDGMTMAAAAKDRRICFE